MSGLRLAPTLGLYAALALAGVAWLHLGGRVAPARLWRPREVARDAALGIAAGLAVVLVTRVAARFSPRAREMEAEFRWALGPQTPWGVPLIAAASAVGEEMFFRGALQAHVGLWIQAAVFGAFHIPFTKRLLGWPVFAAGAGLMFGWLLQTTGSLWAPVLAHAMINQINLTVIAGRR